jgi:hypothetical protein
MTNVAAHLQPGVCYILGCIQKFPDCLLGARTENDTALCYQVQSYCYFMSQCSEFCRRNRLCCFSTSVYCCKRIFRYRLSPETFGYEIVQLTSFFSLLNESVLFSRSLYNTTALSLSLSLSLPCFSQIVLQPCSGHKWLESPGIHFCCLLYFLTHHRPMLSVASSDIGLVTVRPIRIMDWLCHQFIPQLWQLVVVSIHTPISTPAPDRNPGRCGVGSCTDLTTNSPSRPINCDMCCRSRPSVFIHRPMIHKTTCIFLESVAIEMGSLTVSRWGNCHSKWYLGRHKHTIVCPRTQIAGTW